MGSAGDSKARRVATCHRKITGWTPDGNPRMGIQVLVMVLILECSYKSFYILHVYMHAEYFYIYIYMSYNMSRG
jgi:hypothetical protein